MADWWNSISGLERFFWYITVPFSVAFIFRTVLSFIGIAAHGDDADHNLELGHGHGDIVEIDHDFDVETENGDFHDAIEIDHDIDVASDALEHDDIDDYDE